MVGFVGTQARRRKRNRLIFFFLIIIILILFFYFPTMNQSIEEKKLPGEILPNVIDDQSSLISEIEELKLEIFQKDQRIKFRDNQILNLKDEANKMKKSFDLLETKYKKILSNLSDLENNLSINSSENTNEINILQNKIEDLNKLVINYKKQINNLENQINNSISSDDFDDLNIENSILKTELKILKDKNSEANRILNNLKLLIDEKQKEIDKLLYLKDGQHHE